MSEQFFDIEEQTSDTLEKERDNIPSYGSQEWHDYIMSKFETKELIDGNPTCAGLRRVAEDVLGSIVISRPVQIFPSLDANGPGRATVVFEVVFDWMNSGNMRTYSDVADVWHGNTDDLFCAHPVATASTRAEGRALRKALKIRCLSAEELTRKKDVESIVRETINSSKTIDGEWQEEDSISNPQINFIDTKCKQLDINVLKFINSGSEQYDSINTVSKKTGIRMLSTLNEYQNKKRKISEEIAGYDPNWR
jgi:hypothetical protein